MSDTTDTEVLKIDAVSRHYGDGENRLDILTSSGLHLATGPSRNCWR